MKKIILSIMISFLMSLVANGFEKSLLANTPTLDSLPSDQRQVIIENAIILTESFNRFYDSAQKNYGIEQLYAIQSNYKAMSDIDFINAMMSWSLSNEDKHADFVLKGPYENINYFLPFELDYYVDQQGKRHFLVKNILIKELSPGAGTEGAIDVGDEIFEIDGLDINTAFNELLKISDYKVIEAKNRKANRLLYFREASRFFIKTYGLSAHVGYKNKNNKLSNQYYNWYATTEKLSTLYVKKSANDSVIDLSNLNSQFDNIAFKILELNQKRILYAKIDSFSNGMVDLRPFKTEQYDSVLIDVRGNSGGNIMQAENFASLFTAQKISYLRYDFRVNEKILPFIVKNNFNFFNQDSILDFYRKFYVEHTQITTPYSLSSDNPYMKDKFLKPIVVLADSLCFSACENFVSILKNQVGAVIVGVDDHTTAGGGASSVKINDDLLLNLTGSDIDLLPLKKMPYGFELTVPFAANYNLEKGVSILIQDKGVSFTQTILKTGDDIIYFDKNILQQLTKYF